MTVWNDVEGPPRPASAGEILAAGALLGVVAACASTLFVATLGPRIGRDPWLDWFQIGTVLSGDRAVVMQPHWHHFAAGLIVHNATIVTGAVVLFVLLARWSWQQEPARLLVAGAAWTLVTAAAWYYVVFPVAGQTLRMQLPFWAWLGSHAAAALAYPAFPWVRHAVTGWRGPHVASARGAAAALAVAGGLACLWSVAGDAPGPIGPGGDERAFLYEMTNHHVAGIVLARLAADRSDDARVRALARLMVYEQSRENIVMRRWWRAWFGDELPLMTVEDRRGIPGVPAPQDLAALAAASGEALDRRFLALAIAHRDGGVVLADRASRSTADPRVRVLADALRHPLRRQAVLMREWLGAGPTADLTGAGRGRIGSP